MPREIGLQTSGSESREFETLGRQWLSGRNRGSFGVSFRTTATERASRCQVGGNMRAETALALSLAIAVFCFGQQPAPATTQSPSPAQEQKGGEPAAASAKPTLYVYWVHAGISGNKPSVYIDEKEILRMR